MDRKTGFLMSSVFYFAVLKDQSFW
jgi:hypothetical protein